MSCWQVKYQEGSDSLHSLGYESESRMLKIAHLCYWETFHYIQQEGVGVSSPGYLRSSHYLLMAP